jgi:hypothetical protein
MNLPEAAAYYASIGWPVFPCRPGMKTPMTINGCKDATTDPVKVAAWWANHPTANIGLHCADGIAVVDVDVGTDGAGKPINGFESLERAGLTLPGDGVIQQTPRGGRHYIFRATEPVRNKNGWMPGVDIRSTGYYIMLAPSIHPNGKPWQWLTAPQGPLTAYPDAFRPAPAPMPWKDRPTTPPPSTPAIDRAIAYLDSIPPAIQGAGGHDALLWVFRVLVYGYRLSPADAEAVALKHYNPRCQPPWDMSNPADARDFRRKIAEAEKPFGKPLGWLLDEPAMIVRSADDPRLAELGESIAAALMRPRTATPATPKPMADHLLQPPGMVGEIVRWINETSRKEQPLLAVGAALAFAGIILGRKIRTPCDLRSNLYCLGVAETCTGKEHARRQIKRLAADSDADDLLGGEDVTSDAAIEARLADHPATLYLWDEIGYMIANIKLAKGDPHLKKIVPTLLKLYSGSNAIVKCKDYGDRTKSKTLVAPCMGLYGTTVPGKLYSGLTSEELETGLLGRMLVFSSDSDPDENEARANRQDIPAEIVAWCRKWRQFEPQPPADIPALQAAVGQCWPLVVEIDPPAAEMFADWSARFTARRRAATSTQSGMAPLWGRATENAKKIAMILAAGLSDRPVIDAATAGYACQLVDSLVGKLCAAVEANVSDSEMEADRKLILRRITEAGMAGLSTTELTRLTPKLRANVRQEIVRDLAEDEKIVTVRIEGKTKSTVRFFAAQFAPE